MTKKLSLSGMGLTITILFIASMNYDGTFSEFVSKNPYNPAVLLAGFILVYDLFIDRMFNTTKKLKNWIKPKIEAFRQRREQKKNPHSYEVIR